MTQAELDALYADAKEIFYGPECPQAVRDAVEWYHASLSVKAQTGAALEAQERDAARLTDEQIKEIVKQNGRSFYPRDLQVARDVIAALSAGGRGGKT